MVTVVNIGLTVIHLTVLALGVKLYTDHKKQGILREGNAMRRVQ